MAEYVNALEAALQSVERPGTFATGGKTTPFLPDLQVRKLCILKARAGPFWAVELEVGHCPFSFFYYSTVG